MFYPHTGHLPSAPILLMSAFCSRYLSAEWYSGPLFVEGYLLCFVQAVKISTHGYFQWQTLLKWSHLGQ